MSVWSRVRKGNVFGKMECFFGEGIRRQSGVVV